MEEEGQLFSEKLRRHEQVEPKLVAATPHLDQFADLHPMKVTKDEQLPKGLEQSSAKILINKKAIKILLDKNKIAKEMETLQKKVITAYFVDFAKDLTEVDKRCFSGNQRAL